MVLPAQVLESDQPPSDFGLRMRKWVVLVGFVQFLCVMGRVIVGDIMGALCMLFVVAMAYMIGYGDPPLHVRWVFMWAFFCFINAGFDTAIASVRTVHVYQHYDHPNSKNDIKAKVPFWQICAVLVVSWVGAASEVLGAVLGYKLYQDYQEREYQMFIQQQNAMGGYGALLSALHGAGGPGQPGNTPRATQQNNGMNHVRTSSGANPGNVVRPFEGKAHTLD